MFAHSPRSFAYPTTDGADVAQAAAALVAPMPLVHGLENVMLHSGEPRSLAVFEGSGDVIPQLGLGRVDTMNLTQGRKGRKGTIIAPLFSIFTPSFPRKRESRGLQSSPPPEIKYK